MILHDYEWKVPRATERRIYFVGDLHVGNASFDEKNFRKTVRAIEEDDNARYFFMGDGAECITTTDRKRWEFASLDPKFGQSLDNLAQAQINYACNLFEPIKDKCIGYHAGNHELNIMLRNRDYDPMFDYRSLFLQPAGDLGSDIAITRLKFIDDNGSDIIKIYTTHGSGYAITDGGKINKLIRLSDSFPNCDIFARGHLHDCGIHAEPILDVPVRGKLRLLENVRLFVASGCYFRTYTVGHPNYAARRQLKATQLGTPYIELKYTRDTHSGPRKLSYSFGIKPS